jgi:hypothetical protein
VAQALQIGHLGAFFEGLAFGGHGLRALNMAHSLAFATIDFLGVGRMRVKMKYIYRAGVF